MVKIPCQSKQASLERAVPPTVLRTTLVKQTGAFFSAVNGRTPELLSTLFI